jgi:predicted CoA-binding protein
MANPEYSDAYINDVLKSVKTIAMVGASANEVRPSFFVFKYLKEKGYRVIPVNPKMAGDDLLGERVYARLQDIDEPIDMVEVFRGGDAAMEVTEDAIAVGARIVWMQLGVVNDQAAEKAEAAGVKVIMNRCPKMEYGRLNGEMGWVGANSGVIDNRRKPLGKTKPFLTRRPIGGGKGKL